MFLFRKPPPYYHQMDLHYWEGVIRQDIPAIVLHVVFRLAILAFCGKMGKGVIAEDFESS